MSTTEPGWRMISALSRPPFGSVIVSTWTVKIRPSKTLRICAGTIGLSMFTSSSLPARQIVEHLLQVVGQAAR